MFRAGSEPHHLPRPAASATEVSAHARPRPSPDVTGSGNAPGSPSRTHTRAHWAGGGGRHVHRSLGGLARCSLCEQAPAAPPGSAPGPAPGGAHCTPSGRDGPRGHRFIELGGGTWPTLCLSRVTVGKAEWTAPGGGPEIQATRGSRQNPPGQGRGPGSTARGTCVPPDACRAGLALTGQPLLTMLRGSPTWVLAAASPAAPAAPRPPTAPHPPLSTEATGQWHRGNTWPCDRHGPGKEHRAPRPQPAEDAVNRGPKTPQHCGEGQGLGTGGRVGSSGRAAGNQASWLRLGPRGKVPETENSEDAVCIPFCLRSHTQERMPKGSQGSAKILQAFPEQITGADLWPPFCIRIESSPPSLPGQRQATSGLADAASDLRL